MRAPLRFALGNLVWPGAGNAPWALYRLGMDSYEGLSVAGKLELLASLAGWAPGVERDFTLLRAHIRWSAAEYRDARSPSSTSTGACATSTPPGWRTRSAAWASPKGPPRALPLRRLAAPRRGRGPALAAALREPWAASAGRSAGTTPHAHRQGSARVA